MTTCARSSIVRSALGGLFAAFVLLVAGAETTAQTAPAKKGDIVTLSVAGALTPEQRAALDGLLEPDSVSRLITSIAAAGTPAASVCEGQGCFNLTNATTMAVANSTNDLRGTGMTISTTQAWLPPIGHLTGVNEFAIIAGGGTLAAAAGKTSAGSIAVPAETLRSNNIFPTNGQIVIPPGTSRAAVSLIEKDVRIGGASERQFRINRLLPDDEVARRLAVLGAAPNVAVTSAAPQEGFSFIQFQSTGAACGSTPPDWPYDATKVASVARFNDAIRKRLKVGAPKRARVLVVDTGAGRGFLQNEAFAPVVFADPAEMLAPVSAQRQFSGDPICVDGNNNGYWRDVYGTGAGPDINDENRCLDPSIDHVDLVRPHPRKPTSSQLYNPDHGSFVGALAAGGPAFIAAYPDVANLLGLSFFRVTRRSDAPTHHVENSFSDIQRSLEYAALIGADVINMSLRTARDTAFNIFREKGTALLVASAGNLMEDLDQRAPENRPASLLDMNDRMIVVAALQRVDANPFWPDSARSANRVHIAAPGAEIPSLGASGQNLCDSGTSAAAPLVSFVAAMLRATTGAPREVVRARLLAAADHEPKLQGFVEDARRLNIESALDVFVDRVETTSGTKRGWIDPNATSRLVRICSADGPGLPDFRGTIDLGLLWQWRRQADGKVSFRHQIEGQKFIPETCDAPSGTFAFFDLATGATSDIEWSSVTKLLPTPFRSVRPIILKSDSSGSERR